MVQYILECIAFQLVFLMIYDFFLKRETFFQWNRVYLIGTYLFSLILPWIKIEAFRLLLPEQYYEYPEYLWGTKNADIVAVAQSPQFQISWELGLFVGGMILAALLFGYKMLQLYRLRRKGIIRYFQDFTRIIIADSHAAFSFFKSIFLGDKVLEKEYLNIIEHELVHIRQRHSYDLLFFELMRIVGWFNPLVYVYQNRVSELHEFIADAQVAKSNKEEQYEMLLSQAFQTHNISFINPFYRSSLIKKRIVMLTKEKSLNILKLKYLALLPLLIGMLFYTSCEHDLDQTGENQESITVGDIENLTEAEESEAFARLIELSNREKVWNYSIKDKNSTINFTAAPQGSGISGPNGMLIKAKMQIESNVLDNNFDIFGLDPSTSDQVAVPFGVVEDVPIFPGCENAADPRACFQEMMQKHISKNFRYPEEAQEKGIQGRVAILFTIDEDGYIENIKMRGPDKLLEQEAERIISNLPKMTPGKQKGKAVNVPFSIPITFKLHSAAFGNFSDGDEGHENKADGSEKHLELKNTLYFLDGKEITKEKIDLLNPADIESMNVIKGRSAVEKYGTEANDGVIEIRTKANNKVSENNNSQ